MNHAGNNRFHPILALIPPLLAFALQWTFWSAFQPFVWFLFYPAVFFSAWIGGLIPGLISTIASALIVWWFFIPPQFSFSIGSPMMLVSIFMFCIMGGLFSFTLGRLRALIRQADQTNDILRASEAYLSVTLNAIGDGVMSTDAQGCVVRLNPVAEQLTGWLQAEAAGRPASEIFHIVSKDTRLPAMIPVMETLAMGKVQGLANHTVLIARDGRECDIADSCAPIRDHDGQVIGAVRVFRDVTAEYAVQTKLRDSARQIETMLNSVGEGIHGIDLNGNIIFENHVATTLFGWAEQEMIGRPAHNLIHHTRADGSPYPQEECPIYAALHGKSSPCIEDEVFWRKDGTSFPASYNATPMRNDAGEILGAIVSFSDITERQQSEKKLVAAKEMAEQANHAKDSFLTTMSHEIRTPLTGMLGMLEVLSMTSLDSDQYKTLQTAWDSARSLLRIVNDILDWSRIQEGRLALAPQSTAIPQLLQEVVNTYSHIASAKNLVLWQHSDSRLSAAHIVDPLRLSQVLNNYVSNAIKFTPRGEIELRAEYIESLESGERIRFSVKDTGIGIPREIQESVFKRYQQASADTARQYGGTGLGLAICRRLADLLDGQIGLSSEQGRGSTFSITVVLPISAAPGESIPTLFPLVEHRAVRPLLGKSEDAPLVLAVDDHPVNRDLLARQIGLLGLRAETAEDGNAALQKWREGRFSLVITDCHMPEMDGYALARAIRQIEAEKRLPRTPVIAWTANALPGELEHCQAAGMDELLVKPTDLTLLKRTLTRWLSLSDSEDATPLASDVKEPVDYAALCIIVPDKAEQLKVLQDFQSHIEADLAKLVGMLAGGDLVNAERTAHRMKGSCSMAGVIRMADACAAIEQAGRDGKIGEAQSGLTGLYEACRLFEAHLNERVEGAQK